MDATTSPHRSPTCSLLLAAGVLLAMLAVLRPLAELDTPLSRNHNEGWNAHHARNLSQGEDLYPPLDAFVSNNYPPLSFVVLATLDRAGVDPWIAGRLLSLLGMLVVAVQVARFTARCEQMRGAGLLAGALFLATIGAYYQDYLAMNDPQWSGQAMQWIGLGILLGGASPTRRRIGLAIACFVIGGSMKHNLLAVPLGASWWIWHHHPRQRRFWALTCGAGLLAWLAFVASFGVDALGGVFHHARVLSAHHFARTLSRWWLPVLPLLVAIAASSRDLPPKARAFVPISVFGVGVALAFSFGEGVSYNVLFDALAASTVLAVSTAVRRPRVAWLLLAPALLMAPRLALDTKEAIATRASRVAAVEADLDWVREHSGPILCEDPGIAYWAQRPFAVGFFNYGQKIRTGRVDPEALLQRLRSHEFAVVQVDRRSAETALGPSFRDTLLESYRVGRRSPVSGVFFVPREGSTQPQ